MLKVLDDPSISANFRSTTWILLGGFIFPLLACITSLRIVLAINIILILFRIVPALLITGGIMDNPELKQVQPGRTSVMFPKRDGSPGPNPSGEGVAVLILGAKFSHPLGLFSPGAKQTGDFFDALVKDLNAHPTERGWLGGSLVSGRPSDPSSNKHFSIIGYFKTMEDLHNFAHAPAHREAWAWWNANAKSLPHIGLYHEAYDVPARHWETVYLQTPAMGMGAIKLQNKNGEWENPLVDARKGVWRSSAGRMGREAGKTYNDDPY